MTKDYFQDIVPPSSNKKHSTPLTPVRTAPSYEHSAPPVPLTKPHHAEMEEIDMEDISIDAPLPVRGIRNIAPNPTRPTRSRMPSYEPHSGGNKKSSNLWLWGISGLCVVALGSFLFISMRPTTVTIVPRTQNIVFGETAQFVAYPAGTEASGTLAYSLLATDIDDSQVVAAQGTEHVDSRASGSVTIYNNFSTTPQKLIKNTRFQTPEGLVFRAPADIIVPGKTGSNPGHITVTVAADQVGPQYNIGPVTKFSLPGLQSNTAMYANIYAQSTAAMAGGQSGDQAAVAPADQTAAISQMRTRLEKAAHDTIAASSTPDSTVFDSLIQITYQDLPSTPESDGSVRLHERAHVQVPTFNSLTFAQAVAQIVASKTDADPVSLIGKNGYNAVLNVASTTVLGTDPINFSLTGNAILVWQIDADALAKKLAGTDESTFQTTITAFPGVQEANAKVEPFWKKSFPTDPTSIKIKIEAPQVAN